MNSGSSKNVVSKKLGNAMGLANVKHPNPYRVGWIKRGVEFTMIEKCLVPLSIRRYYQD